MVRRVAVTRPLPDGAPRLVSAMIDAVLADAGTASPALVEHLLALRRGLAGSGRSDAGRVIETITSCFDREGWQYYADRNAHKILIQFSFPYGETRLVCSASADDQLLIVALTVVQLEPHHRREIEDVLRRFMGVRAEFDDGDKTVTLHYTLPAAASLTQHEIRNAVVHVNGAAEHVIMRIRQLR